MAQVIAIQVQSRAARVEARINDIPVYVNRDEDFVTYGAPVHEFLAGDEVSVELILFPGADPTAPRAAPAAGAPGPSAAARLRLAVFEEGDKMTFEAGRTLAELTLAHDPERPDAWPRVATASARLPDPGYDWRWARAPVLSLDAPLRQGLDALVAHLAQAFAARDGATLAAFMAVVHQELARCYPAMSARFMAEDFANDVSTGAGIEDWRPRPFDPEATAYRLVAGGRMVECLGRDGLPLIRTETDDLLTPERDPNYWGIGIMVGLNGRALEVWR